MSAYITLTVGAAALRRDGGSDPTPTWIVVDHYLGVDIRSAMSERDCGGGRSILVAETRIAVARRPVAICLPCGSNCMNRAAAAGRRGRPSADRSVEKKKLLYL